MLVAAMSTDWSQLSMYVGISASVALQ